MPSDYVKFEIFLPTSFRAVGGKEKSITEREIKDFCKEVAKRFGGYTESNPSKPAPYRGWWLSKGITYADYIITIFTFVKLRDQKKARRFFEAWQRKLESRLNQKFILIWFHRIKVIGQL